MIDKNTLESEREITIRLRGSARRIRGGENNYH